MSLILRPHATVTEFLAHARAKLEEREAENNLPLGLTEEIERAPTRYRDPFFATITGDGDDAGCFLAALMTPPYPLIIYRTDGAGDESLHVLATHLSERGLTVGGVTAQAATAGAFAQVWAALTGQRAVLFRNMRVFELRQVIPPQVNGESRWATTADKALIARWVEGFGTDINEPITPDQAQKAARRMIHDQDLLLWVAEGRVVSMAGRRRRTTHGNVVAYVYTPPEERGHGYASGVTAALSQHLLDSGGEFCALFTDLANPTSNSIYQKIGYRPLRDYDSYHFE